MQHLIDRAAIAEATSLLREAILLTPAAVDLRMQLADLQAANGRIDEGEQEFAEALRIAPDEPEVWERRGQARLRNGRTTDAIADFTAALTLRPQNAQLKELVDSTLGWRFINPVMRARYGVDSMTQTAENLARRYEIPRQEQDEFALRSQQKADATWERRAKEIEPVEVPGPRGSVTRVERDEHPRPETTLEGLAKLKPVFDQETGTVTAGTLTANIKTVWAGGLNGGPPGTVGQHVLGNERDNDEVARVLGLKQVFNFNYGNHRMGAYEYLGWKTVWAVIWYNNEDEYIQGEGELE